MSFTMLKGTKLVTAIFWLLGILTTSEGTAFNLADSANCFSVNFYKILASNTKGNMISSPFSADVVLSMLLAGAGGKTAQELQAALQYGTAANADVATAFKSDLGQLNQGDGKNTLSIADSVWIQQAFTVQDAFQKTVTNDFYAEEQNLDFANDAHGATDTINNWANKETKGLIPKLFDEDLDSSTVMVLANAIYFKGVWKYKFDPKITQKQTFTNDDSSKTHEVPLMNQRAEFNYKQDNTLNAEILEMDYVGDQISMQLILPAEGTKMADFEKSLNCSYFKDAIKSGYSSLVDVTMPKFDILSTFDLITPLMQSGIQTVFTPAANLTGISANLQVSKAIQKAVVKVYEEGSEAAAVTGLGVELSDSVDGPPPPQVIYFTANRPFMFLIFHKPTNLVLFMGRVESF